MGRNGRALMCVTVRVPQHVARAIAAVLVLRVLVDGCVWLLSTRIGDEARGVL